MLRQRFYGILAGYGDCNDHDTLRDDPVFKLVAGDGAGDTPLASQPTLSRFENLATPAVLQKLIDFTIAEVVRTTRRVIVRLATQWPWWPNYQAASITGLATPAPG